MPGTLRFRVSETDLGWVAVVTSDAGLRSITLPRKTREQALEEAAANGGDEPVADSEARILDAAMRALTSGSPLDTALPIDWTGITPFRKQVLEECASIPAGETRSYAWLAEQAGRPARSRCRPRHGHQPLALLIPCHRVVGSDGPPRLRGGGLP